MAYDASAYVAPGRSLSDLLDYSDDDEEDYYCGAQSGGGYVDVQATKHGETVAKVVDGGGGSGGGMSGANVQGGPTSLAKFQPAQHKNANRGVLNRIHIDNFSVHSSSAGVDAHKGSSGGGASGAKAMNAKVVTEMYEATLPSHGSKRSGGAKDVDRSERATVENVLDPRTRLLLYKLVNTNFFREIYGCVSTGKEANVYYAVCGDGSPAAVKVYKTSILTFKDRDRYVAGEFRFQRYCKSNPRKMVRTWAEKEARNLTRLRDKGVLVPAVKLLRQNILVLDFIGEDGWPAPRLKDVHFPTLAALDRCYLELCSTIRIMFIFCRLIHGDLSEYNLLLFRGHVVVIDVSQSVEHDHPLSMDFLRRDLVNMTNFFRSKGHRELFRIQDLFLFVTSPTLPDLDEGSTPYLRNNNSSGPRLPHRMGTSSSLHGIRATTMVGKQESEKVVSDVEEAKEATTASSASVLDTKPPHPREDNCLATDRMAEFTKYLRDWRAQQPSVIQRVEERCTEDGEEASDTMGKQQQQDKVDEQVFLQINVPRALAEFSDVKPPNSELQFFMKQMIAAEHTNQKENEDSSEVTGPSSSAKGRRAINGSTIPVVEKAGISTCESGTSVKVAKKKVSNDFPSPIDKVADVHFLDPASPLTSCISGVKGVGAHRTRTEDSHDMDEAEDLRPPVSCEDTISSETARSALDGLDRSGNKNVSFPIEENERKKKSGRKSRMAFDEMNHHRHRNSCSESEEEEEEEEDEEEIGGEEEWEVKRNTIHAPHMTREERKEHTKQVKEAQRLKRVEKSEAKRGKKSKKKK